MVSQPDRSHRRLGTVRRLPRQIGTHYRAAIITVAHLQRARPSRTTSHSRNRLPAGRGHSSHRIGMAWTSTFRLPQTRSHPAYAEGSHRTPDPDPAAAGSREQRTNSVSSSPRGGMTQETSSAAARQVFPHRRHQPVSWSVGTAFPFREGGQPQARSSLRHHPMSVYSGTAINFVWKKAVDEETAIRRRPSGADRSNGSGKSTLMRLLAQTRAGRRAEDPARAKLLAICRKTSCAATGNAGRFGALGLCRK